MVGVGIGSTFAAFIFCGIALVGLLWGVKHLAPMWPEPEQKVEKIRRVAAMIRAERAVLQAGLRKRAGNNLFISPIDQSILAVNPETREIILGTIGEPIFVPFGKILAAEIITDGSTITKTNGGFQTVGVAVGGFLLRPLGLLTGSLTDSKRAATKLTELSLRVTIDDLDDPVHTICLLKSKPLDLESRHIRLFLEQAERLHANLIMAMKKKAVA